jgi:predicted dehydrogenase
MSQAESRHSPCFAQGLSWVLRELMELLPSALDSGLVWRICDDDSYLGAPGTVSREAGGALSPRVVVRGAGSIGLRHATVLRDLGAETLLWPVRERAEPRDPETGVVLVSASEAIGSYAGADLVVIATDTSRHVQDTLAALEGGCRRVLLEKPVAPDLASCLSLLNHPRAHDVFVAAPLRAHLGFRFVMSRVSEVGAPASAHISAQSWLPDWRPRDDYRRSYSARAGEGGVLRDLVHEIDYASLLFGMPTYLTAQLERHGPLEMDAEQGASMLWRTASGATITMRLDYITRPGVRRLELHGPEGSLCWDVSAATVRMTSSGGEVSETTFGDDRDRNVVMTTQATAALTLAPSDDPGVLRAAGAPATVREGCAAVAICDQARQSDLSASGTRPAGFFSNQTPMEGMTRT